MTLAAAIPVDEPIAPAGTALLTVRPAPRREPPFDDEVAGEAAMFPTRFDRPLPFPRAVPGTTPELRPRYDRDLPEPSSWARRLLIGLVETASGKRPAHQMGDLLTPSIAQGIQGEFRRADEIGRHHWLRGATLLSVRTMQPRAGVAEISASICAGTRVRAVAMRIERRHDQWRCTRIVLG